VNPLRTTLSLVLSVAWLLALAGCPEPDDDDSLAMDDDDSVFVDDDDSVLVDDDDTSGADDDDSSTLPVDADGDGSPADEDCDDADPDNYPGGDEVCDGADNDCDGAVGPDEVDDDGDGVDECGGDCDDGDAANFPGNVEVCDGIDNDCDPATNEQTDGDGDGASALCDGDCDDGDASNFPGNPELCDGLDNDCDGAVGPDEVDADGDGLSVCDGDCDDGDASNFPGNAEVCDGLDNDCDGALSFEEVDHDADGQTVCDGDCDDGDQDNFVGNTEVCDGADNDCSGAPSDEELDGDGDGQSECDGDCDDGDPANFAGNAEVCDDADNDCDGLPGFDELDGDGDGQTVCDGDCDGFDPDNFAGGIEVCDGADNDCDGAPGPDEADDDSDGFAGCDGDCDDAEPARYPGNAEVCDGLDNDCDGLLWGDEVDTDGDGVDECDGDCDDAEPAIFPGNPEVCDGLDNDCSGIVDDGLHPLVVGDGAGVAIPEDTSASSGPTTVTAAVDTSLPVVDLDVRIELEHTWVSDLTLTLTSPAGTAITLSAAAGGAGEDLLGVLFDDEATEAFSGVTEALAPFTGRWLPDEPLSTFDGEDPSGTWTLEIDDCCVGDSGTLLSWELHLNQPTDGSSIDCPAIDCASALAADPAASDGPYWIDPLGLIPFVVQCEMGTDGGGWIVTALDDSDAVLVGSNEYSNPWHKCADDVAWYFGHLGVDTSVGEDYVGGVYVEPVVLDYWNPAAGAPFTADQLTALRQVVSEQSATVRLVAITADDDSYDWQTDGLYGHEVYAYDVAGELLILTPGTNDECGGSSGWPASGSQSAYYLWSSDEASSELLGGWNSLSSEFGALPPSFTLPHTVELIVQTGGGVAFGWEDAEFLVR